MSTVVAYFDETQHPNGSTLSALRRIVPRDYTSRSNNVQLHIGPKVQEKLNIFPEPYSFEPKMLNVKIPTENELPIWFYETVNALNSLLDLSENWDSYGAYTVNEDAAIATIKLLAFVMEEYTPLPTFVPTPLGNIQLEWHSFGIDLEVEINPSGKFLIYFEDEFEKIEPYENDLNYHSVDDLQKLFAFVQKITQRA